MTDPSSSSSFRFASVHSAAPSVHPVSRGFTRARIGVGLGSFVFAWVHSGAHRCRRVHSSSLWFIRARKVVIMFIRVRLGSRGRA